jgi:hypothetical protein
MDDLLFHSRKCAVVWRPGKSFNYVCCLCDYNVNGRTDMKRHLQTHTGEKPYKCSHCGYETLRSHDLKRHMRIKHKIVGKS